MSYTLTISYEADSLMDVLGILEQLNAADLESVTGTITDPAGSIITIDPTATPKLVDPMLNIMLDNIELNRRLDSYQERLEALDERLEAFDERQATYWSEARDYQGRFRGLLADFNGESNARLTLQGQVDALMATVTSMIPEPPL